MGGRDAQYAVEMATVITGSREELRKRPPLSSLICTVSPLMQDQPGIEAAMTFAEAGIPVGFLAMPTLGTTAPSTQAGALAMGDAGDHQRHSPHAIDVPRLSRLSFDDASLGRHAHWRLRQLSA